MKTWMAMAAAVVMAGGSAWAQEPASPAAAPQAQDPAAPAAPAVPAAPEKGKPKKAGMLGLPTGAELKEKCGFDEEQATKSDAVLASYKDRVAENMKAVKEAADKKVAAQTTRALREEIVGKLKEICKDDAQKAKFDEATAAPKKKKADK